MADNIKTSDPFFEREARKYVHPIPSRECIMQYLENLGRPASRSHLIKAFQLQSDDSQEALRRRLVAMLRDGQLLVNRKGSFALVKQMELVRGRVVSAKEGFGFLVPDNDSQDIFLNPRQMRTLFPGDRILVSLTGVKLRGRRECVVVEILERAFSQIVGRYFEENNFAHVAPANKDIMQDVIIPQGKNFNAEHGQLVVANIIAYPTAHCGAVAEIIEVLGEHMAPGMEIEVAVRAHGLPHKWSDGVLDECKQIKSNIGLDGRIDLRDLFFVTIDGADAKDFDDAVYCEKQQKNGWKLFVAIADVSHYVRFDSNLDQEALARGNSVYFPKQVIPMLPEILSNELCSLKPSVDRLAMVCEMQINSFGKITDYKFYDAIINSHARLTYDEVYDFLEEKIPCHDPLFQHLQELRNLHQVLLKQRQVRGALEFTSIETKIIFGKGRKIERIEPVYNHYVHSIIEECMLAANVCASEFLLKGKIPALFRVHAGPDPEKLADVRSFLSGLGLKLGGGKEPKSKDFAKLLIEISGRPDEHLVQTVLLRSMRQAIYTPENIGHFGLAYNAYAHFTSPIRRFPDLLNHRAIRFLLHAGKVTDYAYSFEEMHNYGEHCSMTERRADDATRDAISWLKCEFMLDKVGKRFVGIISGVANFGVFVELKDIFVEGLLHITSLKNDYYKLDAIKHRLVGKRSGAVYCLGDPIEVLVSRVDLDEREIDFELVE
ncbi:MAG: ribonuclease R [Gammaproteobacteria bacterium]|nr:ribonuclease R [Gammaproteobacteria bacterium]